MGGGGGVQWGLIRVRVDVKKVRIERGKNIIASYMQRGHCAQYTP